VAEDHDVPFRDPIATVLEVANQGDVLRISVQIAGRLHPPLFPASLLVREGEEAVRLDRLISQTSDGTFSFESYGETETAVIPGQTFVFRPWWTPDALALVEDTTRRWVRERYPNNGSHEHCPLTWETIAANEGDGTGYRSGTDWISVTAYEQYVRDDKLHVRRGRS
jgi:hypothetical protein